LKVGILSFQGSFLDHSKSLDAIGLSSVLIKNDTNINEGSFNAGMKLNLINPKMWVFYLSVLPIFVTENENVFTQLIILGAITIFVNLIADISYAYMSSYFFQDSSVKTKKVINAVSGFCLILIGIYLFFSRFL